MRSNAFWRALGAGASAPALLCAPKQHYMDYATLLPDMMPTLDVNDHSSSVTGATEALHVIQHDQKF